MIFKLHLSREEIETLSAAVLNYSNVLTQSLSIPAPDDQKAELQTDLERAEIISQKIQLLQNYVRAVMECQKAHCKMNQEKQKYSAFIGHGKAADPELLSLDSLEVLSDTE